MKSRNRIGHRFFPCLNENQIMPKSNKRRHSKITPKVVLADVFKPVHEAKLYVPKHSSGITVIAAQRSHGPVHNAKTLVRKGLPHLL